MIRIWSCVFLVVVAASCGGDSGGACESWTQWGQSAGHRGASCVGGAAMTRALATITYDTLVDAEKADTVTPDDPEPELLVHYQAPLTVGDDLYMMWKSGTYSPCAHDGDAITCDPYRTQTQIWSEKGYRWEGGALVEKWSFASDWKPVPGTGFLDFEPFFQPAVSGDFIYLPGAGGSVFKLRRADGTQVARLQPFGTTLDPDRYVSGPITATSDGTIYFNSVKLDHDAPYTMDVEAELVRIASDGTVRTASYQSLVTGAPAPSDSCRGGFIAAQTPRPWPPADVDGQKVLPPEFPCRSQRPSWNVAPAVGADGTIYTVSRAHATDRTAFVVAVHPDLTPKWTTSLKNIFDDGCGATYLPIDGVDGDAATRFHCRVGATPGVDPATNELPGGRASDASSSSPVALPDGSVLYGAFSGYNGSRGHLVKLGPTGAIVASFDFGWDVTPAVWEHGETYSIVIKDNYYLSTDLAGQGPYFIRQLDAGLHSEWEFTSTNTMSCASDESGQKVCQDDHPAGFEWCINAPAVDKDGVVYANSEDGNIYAIAQGGDRNLAATKRVFLKQSLGAAYTPLAIDAQGRIITLNDGRMTVLGP